MQRNKSILFKKEQEFGGEMDTCVHMAESVHCSPQTTTTLFVSYTPKQNKKFKAWGKKEKGGLNNRN